MSKNKSLKSKILRYAVISLFSLISLSFIFTTIHPRQVNASTNSSYLNFQARLLSASGAIVPDGSYNVEFKLYNVLSSSGSSQGSCTGDAACEWTETYTGANVVTVQNGYLSVNLGSNTAFPSTINWEQPQWLTMRIGGVGGSPSWDAEMSPRIQLTALPYAFVASQLANNAGGNRQTLSFTGTNADTLLLPDVAGATQTLCTLGTTSSAFSYQCAPSSGSQNYVQNTASLQAGTTNYNISGTGTSGALKVNSTGSVNAVQIVNAASANVLNVDTTNARIGINNSFATMTVPTGLTLGQTAGGSLTALATYRYKITAIDSAGGETTASTPEQTIALTAGNKTVTLYWTAVSGASGYKVYRTLANGATNTEVYLSTVTSNYSVTNKISDTGTLTASGTSPPVSNTAYASTNNSNSDLQLSVGGLGTPTGQVYISGISPKDITNGGFRGALNQPIKNFVSGNYEYVPDPGINKLFIYDISNPASPVDVTSGGVTTGAAPRGVYVSGKYAYLSDFTANKLEILDVSNPTSPVSVGSVSMGASATTWDVRVSGSYAYVLNLGINQLTIVNVANPSNPTISGSITVGTGPSGISIIGNYAYLVDYTDNLFQVVNISNPLNPIIVGSISTGASTGPNDVYVQGRYAYVADSTTNTFQIIDISNPVLPVIVSTTTSGSNSYSLYVQGRYAYLTDPNNNKLLVYDVSNPYKPFDVSGGGMSTGITPTSVFVQGRYAYVVDSGSPAAIQTFDLGGAYSQQLQAGGADFGTLTVDSNAQILGSTSIMGGLSVSNGLLVNGTVGISGNENINGGISLTGLTTPVTGPTIARTGGVNNSVTYTYVYTAVNGSGGQTLISPTGTTATGDTFANMIASSGSIYNLITMPASAVTGAVGYDIYRTVGGTSQGLIGYVSASSSAIFKDTGLAASGSTPTTNTSANYSQATTSNTAFQIENVSGTNIFGVDTLGNNINIGTASSATATIVLANSSSPYTIGINAGNTQLASYTLTLPTVAPTAGLCLESGSTTASQLAFANCSSSANISYVPGSESDVYGTSPTTVNSLSTYTAQNIGDLLVLNTQLPNGATSISSVTSSNATWTLAKLTGPAAGGSNYVAMYYGVVTSLSSSNITVTYNTAGTGNNEIAVTEYTAPGINSNSTWGLVSSAGKSVSASTTTITFPTLTSTYAGLAYIGYAQSGSGSTGSGCVTTGFTCIPTVNKTTNPDNVITYNTNTIGGGASIAPVATQSNSQYNSVAGMFTVFVNSNSINNSTTTQKGNFNVQAASSGSVAGVLQGNVAGTADILDLEAGTGTLTDTFSSTGALSTSGIGAPTSVIAESAPSPISGSALAFGSCSASCTNWIYRIVAIDQNGAPTPVSTSYTSVNACNTLTFACSLSLNIPAYTGAKSYKIYRVGYSGTAPTLGVSSDTFGLIGITGYSGAAAFIDSGIQATSPTPTIGSAIGSATVTYAFEVSAIDSNGNESPASTQVTDTLTTNTTPLGVTVSWAPVAGARSYIVFEGSCNTVACTVTPASTLPIAAVYTNSLQYTGAACTLPGFFCFINPTLISGNAYNNVLSTSGNGSFNSLTLTPQNNSQITIGVASGQSSFGQLDVAGTVPYQTTGSINTVSESLSGGLLVTSSITPIDSFVQGNYDYVIGSNNTMDIIDISNPAFPTLLSTYTFSGFISNPTSIYVQGNYAYVTTSLLGLVVLINVSDPANPTLSSSYTNPTTAGAQNIYVQGNYAYVTNYGTNSLTITNISNITGGTAGNAVTYTTPNMIDPISVVVKGSYAYVLATNSINNYSYNFIFNVSNPNSAYFVSSALVYNLSNPTIGQEYVQGKYIYSTGEISGSSYLSISDINNHIYPTSVSYTNLTSPSGGAVVPTSLYVQGNYAFVGENNTKIQVFDISNPALPLSVGYIPTSSNPSSISIQGRYAYITTTNSLQVFDLGGAYIQQLQAGGVQASTLQVDDNTNLGGDLAVGGGLTVSGPTSLQSNLTVDGNAIFRNSTDTVGAFQILNAAGTATLLNIDTASSGTVSLDNSGLAGTLNIGNNGAAGNVAQSINIGTNTSATSTSNVTVGSTIASGTTTLQAGGASVSLVTGGVTVNNSGITLNAFQVTNAAGSSLLNVNTFNSQVNANQLVVGFIKVMSQPAAPTTATYSGTAGTTNYTYKIAAVDANGATTIASPLKITTTTANAALSTTNKVTLGWATSFNAVSYNIYRTATGGTAATGTGATLGLIGTSTTTSFVDTGYPASGTTPTSVGSLGTGVTYWFKVTAIDAQGNESIGTETSGATTTGLATTALSVSWAPIVGARSYNVYYGTTSGGETHGYFSTTNNGYIFTTTAGTTAGAIPTTSYAFANTLSSGGFSQINIGGYNQTSAASGVGTLFVAGNVPVTNVGSINMTSSAAGAGFAVAGNYSYVTSTANNNFQIFDISNPASPIAVNGTGTATNTGPSNIIVSGNYAYVSTTTTLEIFNISNPASPSLSGQISTGAGTSAYIDAVQGKYAYVSDTGTTTTSSFQIFNISNPATPVLSGSSGVASTYGSPNGAFIQGNYAYVAYSLSTSPYTGSLQIFNISNAAAPSSVSSIYTSSTNTKNVYVQGNYAYVTNYGTNGTGANASLQIFNISNQSTPSIVSNTALSGNCGPNTTIVQGRFAYVDCSGWNSASPATSNLMQIFDVSNPASLTNVGNDDSNTASTSIRALHVQGRYIYLTTTTGGFQILDLGGGYVQQLQSGGTETGTILVDNDSTILGSESVAGSLNVSGSTLVNGDLSASGSSTFQDNTNSSTAFTINAAGSAALLTADTSGSQIILGNQTSFGGKITFNDGSSSNQISLSANGTSVGYSLVLPTSAPVTGQCLQTGTISTTVQLVWGGCSGSHPRTINLTAEYSGAILDGSLTSPNNVGTMTSGIDTSADFGSTGYSSMNYYNWNTGNTASAESYDVVAQIPIPTDWSSWAATNPLSITVWSSTTTAGSVKAQVFDTTNSASSLTDITPGSTNTWAVSNPSLLGGTYTASTSSTTKFMTIRIRLTNPSGSIQNIRAGNITLSYNSSF